MVLRHSLTHIYVFPASGSDLRLNKLASFCLMVPNDLEPGLTVVGVNASVPIPGSESTFRRLGPRRTGEAGQES